MPLHKWNRDICRWQSQSARQAMDFAFSQVFFCRLYGEEGGIQWPSEVWIKAVRCYRTGNSSKIFFLGQKKKQQHRRAFLGSDWSREKSPKAKKHLGWNYLFLNKGWGTTSGNPSKIQQRPSKRCVNLNCLFWLWQCLCVILWDIN